MVILAVENCHGKRIPFQTISVASFPGAESLYTIYNSILHQHLSSPVNKFAHPIVKMCNSIVQSAFTLHQKVSQSFLPTAIKFHYVFNLRDLSNIFQVRRTRDITN